MNPNSYKEAINYKDWKKAIKSELIFFEKQNIWVGAYVPNENKRIETNRYLELKKME